MIIVVSSEKDEHARAVIEGLSRHKAQVTLLDLSDFPQKSQLSISYSKNERCARYRRLSTFSTELDFSDCRVIWWRRPQQFILHPELNNSEDRNFAYTESYSAFSGLWLTLDTYWINHPTRDEEAARKVYQLKVAQELGFRIPDTCITNSFEQAKRFIEQHGTENTIYKAFSGTKEAWRETRLLKSEEIKLIDSVKYAPVIFQEYIPAEVDLRITVVGKDVFAAAIYSQETSYKVDFRMSMNEASVKAFDLPVDVVERLLAYMKRLGLVYGAIDMRLTPDGEYVFLEINPSGQWLFIEQLTNQPITESMVMHMLKHSHNKVK